MTREVRDLPLMGFEVAVRDSGVQPEDGEVTQQLSIDLFEALMVCVAVTWSQGGYPIA